MSNKKQGFGKFLTGLGIGVGLGVLFAPKSGSETRKELKNKLDEFIVALKDIDVNEVKGEFLAKVDDIKNEFGKPASEVITRLRRKYGD